MPNWCSNTLTLRHNDPAMITRAKTAVVTGNLLNEFVPVPKELTETMAGSYGDSDKQTALEAQEQLNVKTHGYKNWYDFCVNEWGTKWDVGDVHSVRLDSANEISLTFESAWSPPVQAYEKMLDLGFSIEATYYEPGMGYVGSWSDGCDDMYELSSLTSADVREQIPDYLDTEYGISDSMEEYEKENREEVTAWYEDGVKDLNLK